MIKEIGSIFPLDGVYRSEAEPPVGEGDRDVLLYSLCREALYDIAVHWGAADRKVLIPAYTCQTVISPFEAAGWDCVFYNIRKDLRIDIPYLERLVARTEPALLVVHPYFGMDLDEEENAALRMIREKGVGIVVDLTQCIFSVRRPDFADYYVGSYRKWFPVPDGAFLEAGAGSSRFEAPSVENEDFVNMQADAMYLRGRYFENGDQETKAISIRLNKAANKIADNSFVPHRMSAFSSRLKQQQDGNDIQGKRFANYSFLRDSLSPGRWFTFVCADDAEVTTAPLYFPVYVEDRSSLQR